MNIENEDLANVSAIHSGIFITFVVTSSVEPVEPAVNSVDGWMLFTSIQGLILVDGLVQMNQFR